HHRGDRERPPARHAPREQRREQRWGDDQEREVAELPGQPARDGTFALEQVVVDQQQRQRAPPDRVAQRRQIEESAAHGSGTRSYMGATPRLPKMGGPATGGPTFLSRPFRESAWGAGELCSPRTIAGGFGNPSKVSLASNSVTGCAHGLM